jgi:hypothetical protein
MADWMLVVAAERYAAERLFHHDALAVTGIEASPTPVAGDRVALVAGGDEPVVFGLGRVTAAGPGAGTDPDDPQAIEELGPLQVEYTHRFLDQPLPAGELAGGEHPDGGRATAGQAAGTGQAARTEQAAGTDHVGVWELPAGAWDALAGRVDPASRVAAVRRTWLVSLDLPIEAGTAAEAVRMFWSYVQDLGPRELPAFVSPADDELAMQAFVLGAQTNLDPEEED